MINALRKLLCTRKLIWLIPIYAVFYIWAFGALEKRHPAGANLLIIHCPLDDYIPFCEFFILFYLGWFVYMLFAFLYLILLDKTAADFNRFAFYLGIGMTLFLIFSWLVPNGLNLRPEVFHRENIFTRMVAYLYKKDTPTNVMPSIHVYNSAAVYLGLRGTSFFRKHSAARIILLVISVLIILSTAFLKQHSVYDILAGLILAILFWLLLYPRQMRVLRTEKQA